jgi:hypothetical protein
LTSKRRQSHCDGPEITPVANPRLGVALMLLGLVAPLVLGFDRLMGPYSSVQTGWSETLAARTDAYAATVHRPKILFVGGSNMVFGVNADSLGRALGVPVVNYSVNAGIGLDVIAARAARLIGPGDIVVVAPELPHFSHPGPIDRPLRRDFMGLFPTGISDPIAEFPLRQWIAARERSRAAVAATDAWLARRLMRWCLGYKEPAPSDVPVTAYDLRAINDRGDEEFPRPKVPDHVNPTKFLPPWPSAKSYDFVQSEGVDALRILADACRTQHAAFLIMPAVWTKGDAAAKPWVLAMDIDREKDMLERARQLGVTPLLQAGQTVLEPECAFDTLYHLNERGVEIIQERLVSALRPWVEKMPGRAPQAGPSPLQGVSEPTSSTAPGASGR